MKPMIYGFAQSSYVWTVRAAAACKGVDVDFRQIEPGHHKSDEYLALHPFGKVPALVHGDVKLYESLAICIYLDAAFGGRPLRPTDPARLAQMHQWISAINAYLYRPAVVEYLFGYIFPGTEDGAPDRVQIERAMPSLRNFVKVLDENLDGTHLMGHALTIADLFLAPLIFVLYRGPEGQELINDHVNVLRYMKTMQDNEEFMSVAPRSPDA